MENTGIWSAMTPLMGQASLIPSDQQEVLGTWMEDRVVNPPPLSKGAKVWTRELE